MEKKDKGIKGNKGKREQEKKGKTEARVSKGEIILNLFPIVWTFAWNERKQSKYIYLQNQGKVDTDT